MAVVQVPPAVGTSGQQIDVFQLSAASTTYREIVSIGSAFTSSGLAVVTTGGGLMVSLSTADGNIIRIQGATTQVAPVTAVDGLLVELSNPTALALTSGLITISGTPTINIVGTSGAVAPATSSGGLGVTILAGSGSGSTAVNIIGSSGGIGPVTTSGGMLVTIVSGGAGSTVVSLSSAIAISSGLITLSSVHSVTATAATNPWSSAPSFNVPMVSASSGLVQISGTVAIVSASSGVVQVQNQTSDATLLFGYVSSSSANATLITGSPAGYYGYVAFNTTGTFRYVHFYQTSSVPGVGTTANWLHSILVPFSTAGGGGANLMKDHAMAYSTKGLGFTITDGPSSTSTGTIGANDVLLTVGYKT